MIRIRSALRPARTAAGVLLAAAVLSACGGAPVHQGAAAVVGGERIPIAEVQAKVTALRDATAAATPENARPEQAGLVRRTVAELVLDRVIARALADRGLSVSEGEIAEARQADAKMLGGDAALERQLLLRQGVAAADVPVFYRQQIGIRKIAAAAGQDPRTEQGDAVVRKALAEAGTALGVEVNPRYGRWDPEQIALVDAAADWLPRRPAAG
ncbi:SurA N-terminal domain-containing protein [Kitasatospora sp. NPDC051914]|uniref:SurA N-terminal domain-containing protein n=1 Tax=Kitasatospora sp. NPDC051914 TaxID=3154945 RepID=UPI00343E7641